MKPMSERMTDSIAIVLDLQVVSEAQGLPSESQFQTWVTAALSDYNQDAELTIRLVDELEGAELNEQYRKRSGSTNVLSFPFEAPEGVELDLLGDLVICVPVVVREAQEQSKEIEDHWAHLVVHGVLHLLGFDHINEAEAVEMESLEIKILKGLGLSDPYKEQV
jgi:probable rRNA maturation factor